MARSSGMEAAVMCFQHFGANTGAHAREFGKPMNYSFRALALMHLRARRPRVYYIYDNLFMVCTDAKVHGHNLFWQIFSSFF